MTTYWLLLAACLLVCFALYSAGLARKGLPTLWALRSLPVCTILGVVCAKLFYVVLLASSQFSRFGVSALWQLEPRYFSVFGGCVGICLGIAAGAGRGQVAKALDTFAPCGVLLLAGARFGEACLGSLGYGSFLAEGSALARLPFAVQNEWGEWYLAVFLLEGAVALVISLWFFLKKKNRLPGVTFEACTFSLALCQIACESLRNQGMMWGFVHVEQLLCGLTTVLLCARACRKTIAVLTLPKRYAPVLLMLLGIGLLVGVEFACAKGNSTWLAQWGFLLLVLVLVSMGLVQVWTMRRQTMKRNRQAT